MTSVKFISLNCRRLNDYKKRVILYNWVNDINCDVVFLQETHFISEKNIFLIQAGKVHLFIVFLLLHTVKVSQF